MRPPGKPRRLTEIALVAVSAITAASTALAIVEPPAVEAADTLLVRHSESPTVLEYERSAESNAPRHQDHQQRKGSVSALRVVESTAPSKRRDPFLEYVQKLENASNDSATTGAEARPSTAPSSSRRQVPRAQFTSGIVNREPIDDLGGDFNINPEQYDKIYYFTELRNLAGHTVVHKWLRDGKVEATVAFEVGGPHWRVYSSKLMGSSMAGDWSVRVEDASGELLQSGYFRVVPR